MRLCPLFITMLLPALIACGAASTGPAPTQPAPTGSTAAPAAEPAHGLPQCAGAPGEHAPALPQPTRAGAAQPCATAVPASVDANAATPLQAQRAIGLPSQGQTVELDVGETFELQLTGAMAWRVKLADNTVIAQLPGMLRPDSQGVFKALAPGRTVLAADGEPLCRSATPACSTPSFHFELALVVRAGR